VVAAVRRRRQRSVVKVLVLCDQIVVVKVGVHSFDNAAVGVHRGGGISSSADDGESKASSGRRRSPPYRAVIVLDGIPRLEGVRAPRKARALVERRLARFAPSGAAHILGYCTYV
jgi:hypothetical protein